MEATGDTIGGIADRELDLLACAIAQSPAMDCARPARTGGIDWARFEALVDRHRVGALALAGAARIGMPADVAARLAGEEERNASNYLRSIALLRKLSDHFARAGIEWVLLKGIAVAEAAYERPALREMIDIDLMVDAVRIEEAEGIILEKGFTRIHPRFALDDAKRANFAKLHSAYSYFRRADGAQLDLHWRTSQNPYFVPQIDAHWREWSGTTVVSGFPTLRPDVHLAYVLAHGAKHGWVRLKWLADVERMVAMLDDAGVALLTATLREHGLETVAGSAFALCHTLFRSRLPEALADLTSSARAAQLHDHALELIAADLPMGGAGIGKPGYLWRRMRHSLGLVRRRGYRRRALLLEVVRSHDLEHVPLPKGWIVPMAIISPVLAVGRAISGKQ
ncbi:nucleotidyltransferase domain-containing protein [Parerythrobacter lacustris]|uniref:Nucleotidyltransferase family protein n=1 Tax=Parerythrobacter lacustris TaxID=2969984 RepID=A0ABT1XNG9_9SPHN|nr:nucleotidyltransferase family protein [Parerythrobacter lacustris]MCR2833201.1 nucleotidyltransferase family protein [Parerythrobacter lacustris]